MKTNDIQALAKKLEDAKLEWREAKSSGLKMYKDTAWQRLREAHREWWNAACARRPQQEN